MTKEELEEEAEDYANKTRIKDKNTYVSFNDECISELQDYEGNYMDISERIIKTYIDSAEPREKHIADLEQEKWELETENKNLLEGNKDKDRQLNNWYSEWQKQEKRIADLEAQIEKLIDFVLSNTECCDVCPIKDTCTNSEGTCPYAGILAKGEEEVTREWLMQFISKEIKEK